jgi:hypothetical protein
MLDATRAALEEKERRAEEWARKELAHEDLAAQYAAVVRESEGTQAVR